MSGVQWNESQILTDRKSRFQARSCAIFNQNEVIGLLEKLVEENKSVQKAGHRHMYAWVTADVTNAAFDKKTNAKKKKGSPKASEGPSGPIVLKNVQQGSNDCGEAGAGQRLLTLLERSHVANVLVVVTRWYGGTALGPARFRHISTTAVESLKKGGFLP
ncbi:unnamed protein product [Kluyveromyces dobzhanskii CBS 2104]|uniref:WGS project CCBQ000000000 data, contig 00015 n=1 Tax=Kluyveromyces dobzhanskii CBS 2104 TaxID=1427455 RepID=A0A0A8LBV2_9SACH|nr:unnamed protein product [Kluyveromyces dobzhanskii CBS 2104]